MATSEPGPCPFSKENPDEFLNAINVTKCYESYKSNTLSETDKVLNKKLREIRMKAEEEKDQEIYESYEILTENEISHAEDYCALVEILNTQQSFESKNIPRILWDKFKKLFS